jgi:hypothetical protein
MKASEAVAQVNASVFRPGWKPFAEEYFGTRVIVGFDIDTVDTRYPGDNAEYPVKIKLRPTRVLDAARLTPALLDYRLLQLAHELDVHEDREFLQRRQPDGTWSAQFHPHTRDGELAWQVLEEAERYYPNYA